MEHFFNYNGLKKSLDFCESKVRDTINSKMIAGLEKSKWFKIKYVHMFAKLCGIEDNVFGIEDIQMPELTEENQKLIENIKKLYGKRDKVETDEYDLESLKQLYKYMLDSLTKKLKMFSSCKSKNRGTDRDKTIYKINDDSVAKYDKLIQIMNPQSKSEYNFMFDEEE